MKEEYVRSLASSTTIESGKTYFDYCTIFKRERNGNKLTGMCKGSSRAPYELEVILNEINGELLSSSCSCPVQSKCKHLIALLFNWVFKPTKFKTGLSSYAPPPSSVLPFSPSQLLSPTPSPSNPSSPSPSVKLEKFSSINNHNNNNNNNNNINDDDNINNNYNYNNYDQEVQNETTPTKSQRKLPTWMSSPNSKFVIYLIYSI